MYDLAHAFRYISYRKDMTEEQYSKLISSLNMLLDNGCTSSDISREILNSFYEDRPFRWKTMSTVNSGNLLKSNTRYYHRKLLIMNGPSIVDHDVNMGTFVSQQEDFFVEPRASYTMQELLGFFYEKTECNIEIYNTKRMAGFLRKIIENFGIDVTLFFIDAISRVESKHGDNFNIEGITDYIPTGQSFLTDVKQNCVDSGGNGYVIRKRIPPM